MYFIKCGDYYISEITISCFIQGAPVIERMSFSKSPICKFPENIAKAICEIVANSEMIEKR